jgi:uncharacterized protein (TIGR02246 family)
VGTSIDADMAAGVHAVIAAYAQALDTDRPDDVAELFCPDGVAEIAGVSTFEGRAAIRAGFAAFTPSRPQLHLVANTVITAPIAPTADSADSATATSDLAFFRRGKAGWTVELVGRYQDTLHLVAGVWRFHHRVTTFRP